MFITDLHIEGATQIAPGLYLTNSFNFDLYLDPKSWDTFPHSIVDGEWISAYGVCDSPEQFMEKIGKHLEESPNKYVVSFVRLRKEDQYPEGGWRWRKWGPYIGTQDHQAEYLFDEPVIEEVYVYSFYQYKG